MGWEWFPETPEEIAEHQRMRRELLKCQQMEEPDVVEDDKKRAHFPSIFVLCLAIFLIVYFLFNG